METKEMLKVKIGESRMCRRKEHGEGTDCGIKVGID